MPGLRDIISGALNGASNPDYNAQVMQQNAATNRLRMEQWQKQHEFLSNALKDNAALISDPYTAARMRDLQLSVAGANPHNTPDLSGYTRQYTQLHDKALKQLEMTQAGGSGGVPPVQGAPPPATAQNSNPFAQLMGPSAVEASPLPGALPAQNPLTSPPPSASGGPASGQASFRAPANSPDPSAATPVQPIGRGDTGAINPVPSSPPAFTLPPGLGGSPLNFQRSVDAMNSGLEMDPLSSALIQPEATLAVGAQKLPLVQHILDQMGPMTDANGLPDMGKLMRAEAQLSALGVQGGNMAPILMQMLQPQSEPGMTEWGMLSEPDKQIFHSAHPEIDISQMDPRTPVRKVVNKITRRTLTIEPQSQIIHYAYGPHGELIPVEGRTAEALPPVAGANGSPAPINPAFVPQSSTSTLNVPGQETQTTSTTRQRGTPAAGASGSTNAIHPVTPGGPHTSAPNLSAATDNSVIATNYRDWVAGKATLSDKEQTAARHYAATHNLPTPDLLSPSGQKAVATLQPILEEIQHARQLMISKGLDKDESFLQLDTKKKLGEAYARYKYARASDPLTKAISDLSFDSLRSVGQALQGTGSRAYPIFQRGLEHTPVIGLNSDSGPMIMDKLDGMERRVRESIEAAMTETKSGIVPGGGVNAIPPVGAPAASDPDNLRQFLRH